VVVPVGLVTSTVSVLVLFTTVLTDSRTIDGDDAVTSGMSGASDAASSGTATSARHQWRSGQGLAWNGLTRDCPRQPRAPPLGYWATCQAD
jgi:hypothetical protein